MVYQKSGVSICAAHCEARTVFPNPLGATTNTARGAGRFSLLINLSR